MQLKHLQIMLQHPVDSATPTQITVKTTGITEALDG